VGAASLDGKVGPITIERARAVNAASAIEAATIARLTFLRGLKHWPTFGKGWQRRVNDVRSVALGMAAANPAPTPTANPLGPLSRLFAAVLGMFKKG
jgi:lysozyme family protein